MPLTGEQLDELRAVNTKVNATPYNGVQGIGEAYDMWTDKPIPGDSWECRDYALAKAEILRERGWNPLDLTIVLCNTEPVGEPPARGYHAVLAVAEQGGAPFILDNRYGDIYLMDQPPYDYQWLDRQIAGTMQFRPISTGDFA